MSLRFFLFGFLFLTVSGELVDTLHEHLCEFIDDTGKEKRFQHYPIPGVTFSEHCILC